MTKTYKIAVLPGDGIGTEVTPAAVRVLEHAARSASLSLEFSEHPFGTDCALANGTPFPDETREACLSADAVLLGAVGSAQPIDPKLLGLLDLRKALGLYANLRPIQSYAEIASATPFRPEVIDGVNFVIMRELSEGLYYGQRTLEDERATDECFYNKSTIERLARASGKMARERGCKVTSVDKVNVLATSKLWRKTFDEVFAKEFADVELEHLLIDAMAMLAISKPRNFGVIATENTFGDVLSDECSVLAGGLGMLPSGSFGKPGPSLYEPVHGSAPDIAGKGIANPTAAILSAAMLAEHSLDSVKVAQSIEVAVRKAFADGLKTADLATQGEAAVGTEEFTNAVIERLG